MHMHMCMHNMQHAHAHVRVPLQALVDINQALSLDVAYCQAYTNRGNCLRKQALHREAMADYGKAIQLAPRDAKAFNNRGALALKMNRRVSVPCPMPHTPPPPTADVSP